MKIQIKKGKSSNRIIGVSMFRILMNPEKYWKKRKIYEKKSKYSRKFFPAYFALIWTNLFFCKSYFCKSYSFQFAQYIFLQLIEHNLLGRNIFNQKKRKKKKPKTKFLCWYIPLMKSVVVIYIPILYSVLNIEFIYFSYFFFFK